MPLTINYVSVYALNIDIMRPWDAYFFMYSRINNTVFDIISELFAYVIFGKKYAQFSEPPCTLNDDWRTGTSVTQFEMENIQTQFPVLTIVEQLGRDCLTSLLCNGSLASSVLYITLLIICWRNTATTGIDRQHLNCDTGRYPAGGNFLSTVDK